MEKKKKITSATKILEKCYGKTPLRWRIQFKLEMWWESFLWKVFGYDRYK
jgi:hypothetical protein